MSYAGRYVPLAGDIVICGHRHRKAETALACAEKLAPWGWRRKAGNRIEALEDGGAVAASEVGADPPEYRDVEHHIRGETPGQEVVVTHRTYYGPEMKGREIRIEIGGLTMEFVANHRDSKSESKAVGMAHMALHLFWRKTPDALVAMWHAAQEGTKDGAEIVPLEVRQEAAASSGGASPRGLAFEFTPRRGDE